MYIEGVLDGKRYEEWLELGVTMSALARRCGISRRQMYNRLAKERADGTPPISPDSSPQKGDSTIPSVPALRDHKQEEAHVALES